MSIKNRIATVESLALTFLIISIAFSKPLPSEIPSTVNKYELRRPLRFSYYRLNTKIQLNPIIGHIARNKNICSSKLGPYCEPINGESLKQLQLAHESLTEAEKQAYRLEQFYQPTRFLMSLEIEKKVFNYFMVPSGQYKMLDELIKKTVSELMHTEQESFFQGEKNSIEK